MSETFRKIRKTRSVSGIQPLRRSSLSLRQYVPREFLITGFSTRFLLPQENEQLRGGVLDLVVLRLARERVFLRGEPRFIIFVTYLKCSREGINIRILFLSSKTNVRMIHSIICLEFLNMIEREICTFVFIFVYIICLKHLCYTYMFLLLCSKSLQSLTNIICHNFYFYPTLTLILNLIYI